MVGKSFATKVARLVKLRLDGRDVILDQKYCWQKVEKKEIRTSKNVTNENKQLNNCKQLWLQAKKSQASGNVIVWREWNVEWKLCHLVAIKSFLPFGDAVWDKLNHDCTSLFGAFNYFFMISIYHFFGFTRSGSCLGLVKAEPKKGGPKRWKWAILAKNNLELNRRIVFYQNERPWAVVRKTTIEDPHFRPLGPSNLKTDRPIITSSHDLVHSICFVKSETDLDYNLVDTSWW